MSDIKTYRCLFSELQRQVKKVNFREYPGLETGKISDNNYSVIIVDEVIKMLKANNWTLYKKGGLIYAHNGECLLNIDIPEIILFMSQVGVNMGAPYCTVMYYRFANRLYKQCLSVIEPIKDEKGANYEY